MLKIAISTPYFPPHIGGVEDHVKNLSDNLRNIGYEIKVISSIGADINVPCIKIPYSPIPITFPQIKADLYHSHVPSPFFARGLNKVAEKEGKPHVITYHNDVVVPSKVNGYSMPRFLGRSVEKINDFMVTRLLEKVDMIIATTKSYAETSPILSKFMDKVKIVPNAVDPSEFRPGVDAGEREPLVLYVGRLVAYKGVSTLIKAMAEIQKEIDAKLVVVGDGEDRKAFERLAEKLSVKAVFTGRVPRKEVVEWMQKARVLVLPSYSRLEAFGIVLLEAMACSTPVIGANTPGVFEVALQGGFTFNSLQELVEKIKEVLQDDLLATKLGKNGRKAVEEKFNWDFVVERIEKIYFEVLG
ncbi:MAG: glycosyltransferase family 4 protein [Archaeoglobaceae archaeon]|nr:glycosyltransferase family 4 protein [Archaeoglobaceae archaeon]MDW8118064.1 glycosyltransferase family 4 protein [Archaeoglobaceae archaeon]